MMTAWVFDVDGVITNIEQEKITEPIILEFLIKTLEKGEPIALNTGRGMDWVEEIVLNPLKSKISNQEILHNFFVVAESGGIRATFDRNGSLKVLFNDSFKIPPELDRKVRKLVAEKYSRSMRYEDKKTMSTTKIKEGTSFEKFHEDQKMITKDLQEIIDSSQLKDRLKVDTSTIGTNIMFRSLGKDRGAEIILEWLSERKIKPQRFVAFGDSFKSDVPMAEELHSQGFSVDFVYVGEENIDTSKYPFTIKQTQAKFGKGTLEFLKGLTFSS